MNRKTKRKIAKAIPYLIIVLFFCWFFKLKWDEKHLMEYKGFTNGLVTHFAREQKGNGGSVDYEYIVNGVAYKGTTAYPRIDPDKGYLLVGKKFPLAYDTTQPGNSYMLITPNHFEYYKLAFPDSLEWTKDLQRYKEAY